VGEEANAAEDRAGGGVVTWLVFLAWIFAGLIVIGGLLLFFAIVNARDDGPPDPPPHMLPPLRDQKGKPVMPPNRLQRSGSERDRPALSLPVGAKWGVFSKENKLIATDHPDVPPPGAVGPK
jgi:hypothetical protein